jgi:arginine:pyruvate transaminase
MLYGLPGFVQEAALTAIGIAPEAESRMRDYCRERCAFVLAALAQTPGLVCMPPDAGMFMLIDVRGTGLSGYDFMLELYRSQAVSVLDGGAFGRGTAGFIRLCFTTDERSLHEGCVRIRRFAASLRSKEGA